MWKIYYSNNHHNAIIIPSRLYSWRRHFPEFPFWYYRDIPDSDFIAIFPFKMLSRYSQLLYYRDILHSHTIVIFPILILHWSSPFKYYRDIPYSDIILIFPILILSRYFPFWWYRDIPHSNIISLVSINLISAHITNSMEPSFCLIEIEHWVEFIARSNNTLVA